MRIYARYDMPCELFDGNLTRREWTEQELGKQCPDLDIPEAGEFLWTLYSSACDAVPRQRDGGYYLISPSEWDAWLRLNQHSISAEEWECLHAMDVQYCTELNNDAAALRERDRERQQQQQTGAPSKRRR